MSENIGTYELDVPFKAFYTDTPDCEPCIRYYAVLFEVYSGSAVISFGNTSVTLKSGQMCLIRPLVSYSISCAEGRFAELHFDIHTLELPKPFVSEMYRLFGEKCGNDEKYTVFSAKSIHGFLENLIKLSESEYFIAYSLLISILSWLCGHLNVSGGNDKFYRICEFIDVHSSEQTEASDIAEMCGMSYSAFAKRFHEQFGRSCKEHISYVRTVKARTLLMNTDMELTDIAHETGFFDCSHLIRNYKRRFGVTPNRDRINRRK